MKVSYQNLEDTLRVLAITPNESAVPVMLAALEWGDARVSDQTFPLLLMRHSPEAETEILRRWPHLREHWKQLIIRRDGWLSPAVRRALLGDDLELATIACDAAVALCDYDLIPVLVSAVCEKRSAITDKAVCAILALTEHLAEESGLPRDYRNRKDPQLERAHALASVEKGVQTYDFHLRRELLEALLILASRENAVLNKILQEPTERSFVPLMELLTQSTRPEVIRLLFSYLEDPYAPLPGLHALARRRDITCLRQLCRKIEEPSTAIRVNLKRIENIPWLRAHRFVLDALHEKEQAGAVRYLVSSGIPRQEALEGIAHILKHGKPLGRRAASAALAEFRGADANLVAQTALEDPDPQVRASLATQLRTRGTPGSMNRLVAMLDSPHEVERQAARKALEEFSFAGYAASFDYWDEDMRARTGLLVKRIDDKAAVLLREELQSTSRSRRRRGLEMVVHMGLVAELQDAIATLAKDDDQYVRLEAVRVLGNCPTEISSQVLREALSDQRVLVQEAAERGLAEMFPDIPGSDRLTTPFPIVGASEAQPAAPVTPA